MQFFTKVPVAIATNPISYTSQVASIGSCFAENIGAKLHFYKFQSITNPFGIIFNAISIEKLIRRAVQKTHFSEADIFFHNERWHCFEIHSELSHSDKHVVLQNLNNILIAFQREISNATHFIITLGTSWIYRSIHSEEIVANCHKIPQKEFSKQLLSASEISQSLQNSMELISSINPTVQFICTISPVRHLKDGFIENQISKANLIAAVYSLSQEKNLNLNYFPSYEIMIDELRDYRFYSKDLLHPNSTAVDYIWSRFIETNIAKSSISTMNEVETIQKGLLHRPFNAASLSHQKFLKNLNEKIEKLQTVNPFIIFSHK
jgi:hypothetical protein